VPIHRWGTAAFGIALLAIACPPLHLGRQLRLARIWFIAPGLIGAFWLMPFMGHPQDWSPDSTRQLLERLAISPTETSLDDLRRIERYFPLNPELHERIGIREMTDARRPDQGWAEFRIADRLLPASWAMPAMQGWLSRDISPGMSFHFWSLSIERSGRRAPDIFMAAYRNSVDRPGGEEFWRGYADAHPEFLLCYAEAASSDERGKAAYDQWWKERGGTSIDLEEWEAPAFYATVRKWGDRAQVEIWAERRPRLQRTDFRMWAAIMHEWHMDADAWRLLSSHIHEPPYPGSGSLDTIDNLEASWRAHPDDPVAAQAYAHQCSIDGEPAKSEQVILIVASGPNPPRWFIEKAAFLYAAKKDYATAVTAMLRLGPADP
jgi:hypothetical protein